MDSSATLHLSTRQLGHLPASQPPDAAIPLLSGWAPMPLGSLPPADSSLTQDEAAAVDRALRTPGDRAWPKHIEDSRGRVENKIREWAFHHARAEKAGVDLPKATFISKLIAVGAAAVSLGVAAALVPLTAGAALPLVIIASVRASVLLADCACAYADWKRAREPSPRPPLPLGANSLGNLTYWLYKACAGGGNEEEKEKWARRSGQAVSVGAAIALAVAGIAMAPVTEGLSLGSTLASGISATTGLSSGVRQTAMAARASTRSRTHNQAAVELFQLLTDEARRLFPLDGEGFEAWCTQMAASLGPDASTAEAFDRLRAMAWKKAAGASSTRPTPKDLAGIGVDTSRVVDNRYQAALFVGQSLGYMTAFEIALANGLGIDLLG